MLATCLCEALSSGDKVEPTISPRDHAGGTRHGPSEADVRAELERILDNPALRMSKRRRALLKYLIDETLAGRGDRLKGVSVALAVFGREVNSDPQSDPVVRFEARRLRSDLDSYYVDAGSRDALRISIPKGGYVPRFEWQDRATRPGEVVAPADDAPAATPINGYAATRRPLAIATLLVALAIAGATGAWFWLARPAPVAEVRGPSVIVLPFETLSSREDDSYLAAGVTQELITDLMRFDGLRVFSVQASFGKDEQRDPVTLGHELSVGYVVKGSVSSDASTVRVAAQLYDAKTGSVLWSQTYDHPPSAAALLEVRATLAADVATVLGQPYGVLNRDMAARLAAGVEPSMASYDCVLRAYTYRRTFRDELRQPVLTCLQAAVARDPDYAEPVALLGWLHLDAARYGFVPDTEAPAEMGMALEFASRAVAIDPQNEVALKALSAVQYHLGNFDESERIQRQALALNPNDPDTLAQLGWRLSLRGRWEEGLAYSQRAIARTIDPPGWYHDPITIHLYLEGRYREMLASAKYSAAGDSQGIAFLAIAYGALGDRAAAQEALEEMARQQPGFARDPAAAWRRFLPLESIIDPLMAGLRKAGWEEPSGLRALNLSG